jgi:raffinose/stachyose/melibiose transport system substrate-binding protein
MLVSITIGLLLCCSGQLFANGTGETTKVQQSNDKVKITFMSRDSGDTPMAKVYEEQLAAFQKENPNIVVQNDSIYEESAYNNKLKVEISTGVTPSIFYYPAIAGLTEWAKNGVIMDLSPALDANPEWKDSFLDGALDTYRLDAYDVKGIYAIPNESNVDAIFYNKALFKKAGITALPTTMDELYADFDKLNAAGITPFGVGGKTTWVMGHIFNNILFKQIGLKGVVALGTGQKKWTDPDVVKALEIAKQLKDKGAFAKGFEGMDYNTQMNQFLSGEVAMISHSSPIIPEIMASDSEIKDQFSFFPFPYFADKPEYKDLHVIYTSGLMVSGSMSKAQQDATIKLLEYLTTKQAIKARMDKAKRIAPFKDAQVPDSAPQIFKDMIAYSSTIKKSGGEYFDYDTSSSLVDVSRNAILDMMLGKSAQETANTIQKSLDASR